MADHFVRPDTRAFLDMLAAMPEMPWPPTPEAYRAQYLAMKDLVDLPLGELATIKDLTIPGPAGDIPARLFDVREKREPGPVVLFFHGGGFVIGNIDSHASFTAELSRALDLPVVSVDYRLAPEHPHPAAFNDALAAARAVAAAFDGPLVLVGDSAGGTLAAAVAHAGRALGLRPWGQVLIYPSLGGDESRGSYQEHAEAPMLTLRDIAFYRRMRFPNGAPRNDPTAAPLQDNNFRDLPPTVIFVAECDPLADDGSAYAEKLLSAGGRALVVVETGLVHGYLRARATVSRARESFRRITTAIAALAQGNWPEELL